MDGVAFIKHAERVIRRFGRWPSFHDAEVLRIEIDRERVTAHITIYAFDMLKDVDAQGYYKQSKHCLITLALREIQEIDLRDFNQQNVLSELSVKQSAKDVIVTLYPTYGVRGRINCREIEVVRVKPLVQARKLRKLGNGS